MGSLTDNLTQDFLANFYADDILKGSAPKVDITFHLDIAYIKFNFPSVGDGIDIISKINYKIIEYGSNTDGTIDKDNILNYVNNSFKPYRVTTAINTDELPLHDVWTDLNPSWYEFQFEYMYDPGGIDGSNVWYSTSCTVQMNNLQPRIFDKAIGKYIIGDLKTSLIDDPFGNTTMWYETDVINPGQFDAIKSKGGMIYKQAAPETGEGVIEQISRYSLRFWLSLFNTEQFIRVVAKHIQENTVQFRLNFNQTNYTITINGDLNKLVTCYWRDYFGDLPPGAIA
ncbi:MAG: hypothetical protein J7L71_06570 [Spirochaetaceae bacterium]|nr:hypothetical protein [Spirochaetaceae bacterium]